MDAQTLVRRLLQEYNPNDDSSGLDIPLPLRCFPLNKQSRPQKTADEPNERKTMDAQRDWQLARVRNGRPS